MDLKRHEACSKLKRKENQQFLNRLTKVKSKALDRLIHPLHEEVFENTNCLVCANCCKTTGPLFTDKDISRIANRLSVKPSVFLKNIYRLMKTGNMF